MNYAEAREVKGGGWHWTSMNDGNVRTAAPCITIREREGWQLGDPIPEEDIKRCEPHATKEEAERHFYDWSLETLHESEWTSAQKCETGCGAWSNKSLGNHFHGYFGDVFLCDFHRNADRVAELKPFRPDIQLIHS